MRIKLDSLEADAIDLELSDDPDTPRTAALRELRQLSGCVHRTAERLHLRPVEARDVDVAALDWSWTTGRITLGASAHLSGVDIDADLGTKRPGGTQLDGRASIANIRASQVRLALGRNRVLIEELTLDRASVDDGREGGHASLGILTATGVEIILGGLIIAADSFTAERARARWEDELQVELGTLRIEGLRIETANLRIDVPVVEAPNGAGFSDGAITFVDVQSDTLTLVIRDLLGFKPTRQDTEDKQDKPAEQDHDATQQPRSGDSDEPHGETSIDDPAASPSPPRRPLFDMRMLDQLDGKLDVDLTADLSVPVLGSRRATHHFRIPIEHGAIDYKQLEGDLSTLEDAIIDFTVRGDKLMLERAVPLLPGLNKPIVVWPLTDVELALAKRKQVRLRTLPSARLASEAKKKSKDSTKSGDGSKPSVAVRELDFANVELEVALRPRRADEEQSEPLEAAFTRASIGSLRVDGRLRHIPDRALDPTLLEFAAEQVQASLTRMFIGGRATLSISDGVIGAVEDATLRFQQLQPQRLGVAFRQIRLSGVSIPLGLRPPVT